MSSWEMPLLRTADLPARALEELPRRRDEHLLDLLVRDAALAQGGEDVVLDVQEVPVGRDLRAHLRRKPVREAVGVVGQDHAVVVAPLAERRDGGNALLEGEQDVEAEA